MLRLENVKIREEIDVDGVLARACDKYKINIENIIEYRVIKKSIDARDKDDIFFNYTIDVKLKNEDKIKKNIIRIEEKKSISKIENNRKSQERPIIVGAGPAGLFCALTLVNNGVKPIVIEQGKCVEERKKDIERFLESGELNVLSNVQFGEGGAGTFSDGKLTTGINNPLCRNVIDSFIKFGAPEQIGYISKPHIGTDNLIKIIASMRKEIIDKGGEFLFETKLENMEVYVDKVVAIEARKSDGQTIKINSDTVILAIGHSARDTFKMLYDKKLNMEKKNFSVGVRIEHSQKMINEAQYGKQSKLKLPPAEYKLAYHGAERSCYTFCMCPGGVIIASSSEENTVVTNGMSKFARDGENANSAVLVNVTPEDFPGESPLDGVNFQKELEEKAFVLGGKNHYAPIQRVGDFFENRKSTSIGKIKPTYKPGVTLSNLQEIFPDYINQTLKEGLRYFDRKIKGFADDDAIMTGVETRSSSPVKIIRDEKMMSNIRGIYPCGEGAGYAGGIMSAAVDGIKCAIAILKE